MLIRQIRWCLAAIGPMLLAAGATAQPSPSPGLATLSANHADAGVAHFYRSRDNRHLWIGDGQPLPEARRLVAILDRAAAQGLPVEKSTLTDLTEAIARVRPGRAADNARAELMLSDAWVSFVQALSMSDKSGTTYIDATLAPRRRFASEILSDVAAAPSLGAYLDAVSKLNPIYDGLVHHLDNWRARWNGAPPIAIPAGPSLTTGDRGERVQLLRMRLGLLPGTVFDSQTAAALIAFKKDQKLPVGPVADPATVARLNATAIEVERRLQSNLERARALPVARSGRYVVVDAASARLWLMDKGTVVGSMKVVVGKAAEPTPMAAGLIRSVVLNPYWNLPPDLVQDRFAESALVGGATYIKDRGYQVLSGWDDKATVLDPRTVDWKAVQAGSETIRMRQLPGPGNAMGAMKFMFPNEFGVYLHDTPDRSLFNETTRAFSSGCVRVEDADRLAAWLFGSAPPKPGGQPEETVPLPQPIPVYLTYITADWSEKGLAFLPDIYGRD